MDTATFEAMRAAMDHRFGLWAVALAVGARRPGADAVAESRAAIERLLAAGDLYAYRAPFAWGAEETLSHEDAKVALQDERHWRPRRIGIRRLVRLAATESGRQRFLAGEFGYPEPIQRELVPAYEGLELQPVSCAEAAGMFVALAGFLVGGWVGATVTGGNPLVSGSIGLLQVFGMSVGSIAGLAGAISVWRLRYADTTSVAADDHFVPDQYMQGPTINTIDEFGEPRF